MEVVRVKITLACTECKQRNYNMTKEKKAHPDRMETKKYCKFCKSHTLHKETKSFATARLILWVKLLKKKNRKKAGLKA